MWSHPLAVARFGPARPGRGLAIEGYLSQWCGALYLDGLDHFAQRVLKPGAWLRYMDDFVLFDDDPERLDAMRVRLATWLAEERGLELNPRHQQVSATRAPVVFLGLRCSRAGLSPSRRLRRRVAWRLGRAALRGPMALERTVRAYRGLLLTP